MIFNQDIATTALSITILEGLAGTFSNSSKGLLNSWSLTLQSVIPFVTRETHCGSFQDMSSLLSGRSQVQCSLAKDGKVSYQMSHHLL